MLRVVPLFVLSCSIALLMSACVADSGSDSGSAVAQATDVYSDTAIATALFSDQRTPVGFYSEQLTGNAYYTIYHINRGHLPGFTGGYKYAVCSDDFSEALAWSEQAANSQPQYRELVDNRDSELFFEFTRSSSSSPQIVHLQRVYKCSFVRPKQLAGDHDLLAENLTPEQIRQYVEYQWLFSSANNTGHSVVNVSTETLINGFKVVLKQAQWLIDVGEECQLIKLYQHDYVLDKVSHELSQSQSYLREFLAARGYHGAMPCERI